MMLVASLLLPACAERTQSDASKATTPLSERDKASNAPKASDSTSSADSNKTPDKRKKPMNVAQWHDIARQALKDKGVPRSETLTFSSGPGHLSRSNVTAPFNFYVARADDARGPGRDATQYCVAVDTRDEKVYYKNDDAFEVLLEAVDFPKNEEFDARKVLEAWYVIHSGAVPQIILNPASVKEEKVKPFVSAPKLDTKDDGTVVVEGWTARMRYRFLDRHTITITADGKASVVTSSADDVVAKGG